MNPYADWIMEAVDEILDGLSGRSGIGDALSAIRDDEEIWEEIREAMAESIASKIPEPEPLTEG